MPTLGATAEHVPEAAALVTGGNATHYWEVSGVIGVLYGKTLGFDGIYAWDVWMIYAPGVRWEGTDPPKPDFAMHQLGSLRGVLPWLDAERFAEVANQYLERLEHER